MQSSLVYSLAYGLLRMWRRSADGGEQGDGEVKVFISL